MDPLEHLAGEHDYEFYSMGFTAMQWAGIAACIEESIPRLDHTKYPFSVADRKHILEHINRQMQEYME